MVLLITIHGREAIPVRAIPLIAGWGSYPLTLDPRHLVHTLYSGKVIAGFSACHPLIAYRRDGDDQLQQLKPNEWRLYEENLKVLTKQWEKEKYRYEEWQQRHIRELPRAVFLWKEAFELFWQQDFLPRMVVPNPSTEEWREDYERHEPPFCDERERLTNWIVYRNFRLREFEEAHHAPPHLDYECHLSSALVKLVFEGFGVEKHRDRKQGLQETTIATATRKDQVIRRRAALREAITNLADLARGGPAEFSLAAIPYPKQRFMALVVHMRSHLLLDQEGQEVLGTLKKAVVQQENIPWYLSEDLKQLNINFRGGRSHKNLVLLKKCFR